jgi:hypothetical protein
LSFFTIATAKTDTSIQNNSDLPQGLKPAFDAQSTARWSRHLDAAFESNPGSIEQTTRRSAMNMSVTQFAAAPAMVGRNQSLWRQVIDTVIEGPPRTTADEIAGYLALHQYDLSPSLRVELERRHVCV